MPNYKAKRPKAHDGSRDSPIRARRGGLPGPAFPRSLPTSPQKYRPIAPKVVSLTYPLPFRNSQHVEQVRKAAANLFGMAKAGEHVEALATTCKIYDWRQGDVIWGLFDRNELPFLRLVVAAMSRVEQTVCGDVPEADLLLNKYWLELGLKTREKNNQALRNNIPKVLNLLDIAVSRGLQHAIFDLGFLCDHLASATLIENDEFKKFEKFVLSIGPDQARECAVKSLPFYVPFFVKNLRPDLAYNTICEVLNTKLFDVTAFKEFNLAIQTRMNNESVPERLMPPTPTQPSPAYLPIENRPQPTQHHVQPPINAWCDPNQGTVSKETEKMGLGTTKYPAGKNLGRRGKRNFSYT